MSDWHLGAQGGLKRSTDCLAFDLLNLSPSIIVSNCQDNRGQVLIGAWWFFGGVKAETHTVPKPDISTSSAGEMGLYAETGLTSPPKLICLMEFSLQNRKDICVYTRLSAGRHAPAPWLVLVTSGDKRSEKDRSEGSWPGNPHRLCRIDTETRHGETEKRHENFVPPEQLGNDVLSGDPQGLLHCAGFPPGLHFREWFCSSWPGLSAGPTCPRRDLSAATSARPRVEW